MTRWGSSSFSIFSSRESCLRVVVAWTCLWMERAFWVRILGGMMIPSAGASGASVVVVFLDLDDDDDDLVAG